MRSALDSILDHANSLSDKLDAYYLKVALVVSVTSLLVLQACHQMDIICTSFLSHILQQPGSQKSYELCLSVLKELGEKIPTKIDPVQINERVQEYSKILMEMVDTDVAELKTSSGQNQIQMMKKFYDQLCFLSYFVGGPVKWYCCRLIELTLEHGFCKYSAIGLMRYAIVLAGKQINDLDAARAVSKMALKILVHFDATDLFPSAYMVSKKFSCWVLPLFHALHTAYHVLPYYPSVIMAILLWIRNLFNPVQTC